MIVKKKYVIVLIVIVSLFISSCTLEVIDINEIITQPKVKHYALNGTWALVENIEISGKKIDRKEIQMGERALFKDKHLYLAGRYTRDAEFILKNLKTLDYFSSKYDRETLLKIVKKDNIKVIDIYDDEEYLLSLIRLSNNKIMIEEEDSFLIYEKVSDESSIEEIEEYISIDREVFKEEQAVNKANKKVGILLGLKKEINPNEWVYGTRYIKYNNGSIKSYYMEDVLLPRKTGFYNLSIKRGKDGRDIIVLSSDKSDYKSKVNKTKNKKNLLYVGNDYISFEKIGDSYNELGIYPLDFIDNDEAIKMSEILKDDDLKRLKFFTRNRKEKSMDEYNFAVRRKAGYWGLENREIIKDKSEYQWRDYELKIPTPKALVNYDDLSIPMWELKNMIPSIQDAFISPKDNLLIADIGKEFLVYEIDNNMELGKELKRIKKAYNEKVIMAEWGTGEYADIWEEEVKGQIKK